MTVSLVEFAEGSNGALTTTPTVAIANTPVAGDHIYITLTGGSNGRLINSITGLGATWVSVAVKNDNNMTLIVWRGTGATASGTITVTMNGTLTSGSLRAYHVRGLTSTLTVWDLAEPTSTLLSLGTIQYAAVNQFVLALTYLSAKTTGNLLVGNLPASGWVINASPAATTTYNHTGYRIPTESAPTPHQIATTAGTNAIRGMMILTLGSPLSNSAVVDVDYTEVLAQRVSAIDAQVDVVYSEVLMPLPPPTMGVGGVYTEVITPRIPPTLGVTGLYTEVLFEKVQIIDPEPPPGSGLFDSEGVDHDVFELMPTYELEWRSFNQKSGG